MVDEPTQVTVRLHAPARSSRERALLAETEEHLSALVQACFAFGPRRGRELCRAITRGVFEGLGAELPPRLREPPPRRRG